MKYLVMECHPSHAVVLDSRGRFRKVPNLDYEVGQEVENVVILEPAGAQTPVLRILSRWAAAVACLCLVSFGSWQLWKTPTGTVRIQINPDVQMQINRFDRVVGMEGLNEDGALLIEHYDPYGQKLETAADGLADQAMELGYLQPGGEIRVTAQSAQSQWKAVTEEKLVIELELHFDHQVRVVIPDSEPEIPAQTTPVTQPPAPTEPAASIPTIVAPEKDDYDDRDYGERDEDDDDRWEDPDDDGDEEVDRDSGDSPYGHSPYGDSEDSGYNDYAHNGSNDHDSGYDQEDDD